MKPLAEHSSRSKIITTILLGVLIAALSSLLEILQDILKGYADNLGIGIAGAAIYALRVIK
ncbi:MAG: hypothetical protein MN733_02430 [Nitrososphaera sp.]|nr:hypothetical protein [Nitrososphaera sp.]